MKASLDLKNKMCEVSVKIAEDFDIGDGVLFYALGFMSKDDIEQTFWMPVLTETGTLEEIKQNTFDSLNRFFDYLIGVEHED
jgi:hypothetical protein